MSTQGNDCMGMPNGKLKAVMTPTASRGELDPGALVHQRERRQPFRTQGPLTSAGRPVQHEQAGRRLEVGVGRRLAESHAAAVSARSSIRRAYTRPDVAQHRSAGAGGGRAPHLLTGGAARHDIADRGSQVLVH